jgi:Mg/Co/Ni transporter MgtE
MEFSVDRYLDDGSSRLVTLAVRSRTTEAHSVLSALDADQKAAVHAALTRAMDEIGAVMRPVAAAMPDNKG